MARCKAFSKEDLSSNALLLNPSLSFVEHIIFLLLFNVDFLKTFLPRCFRVGIDVLLLNSGIIPNVLFMVWSANVAKLFPHYK